MQTYRINEIFLSVQGEGFRSRTLNVFIRFAGCNLQCAMEAGEKSPGGFDCDTEFVSGRAMTAEEICCSAKQTADGKCRWIILTGGEPGLQVDRELIDALKGDFLLAIETNGSIELPKGLDYICVSPKVAEHAIRQRVADEVRYVRGYGQALPKTVVTADHYYISPAFDGHACTKRSFEWCSELVKGDSKWKLSIQKHKVWNIR